MRLPVPLPAVAAAALIVTWAVVPASAERRDRLVKTVGGKPGRPVHVRVTVGEVSVRAEDRSDVAVEIERSVPDEVAPEALPVRVDADDDDALRVSALQPGTDRDPSLKARVTVAVPRDTGVLVEVGQGACEVDGVRAPLRAHVDRGPITLRRVAGLVRAETGTGDILVEDAELPPDGQLRLRTMTGNVTVALASRPAHARLLLLAMSGRVTSTEPLQERGGPGRRLKEAVIGSGKAPFSVDVVRGDIVVRMP